VTDAAWIDLALRSARPRAVGALLRYFGDLDTAEEAFQEACLAALTKWPENGPPRDVAAWLIFVGRNAALDRRAPARTRSARCPPRPRCRRPDDREARCGRPLDDAHYRDDVLRCCSSAAIPSCRRRSRSRSRCASSPGLTVKEIARAFLVGETAMEQRITRAKARIAAADIPFETPGPDERAARLRTVAAMIYLVFNEATRPRAARRSGAPRCAARRSGSRACCSGCFATSPR
jgi:RNA polymerase sigma-70 factor (ECF subfamily)